MTLQEKIDLLETELFALKKKRKEEEEKEQECKVIDCIQLDIIGRNCIAVSSFFPKFGKRESLYKFQHITEGGIVLLKGTYLDVAVRANLNGLLRVVYAFPLTF
jgi:hypothetical protein